MFLLLGVVMLITIAILILKIPSLLLNTILNILRLRYKIEVHGREVMDSTKNYLVLPNHSAIIDPVIVYSSLYETPIRPFVDETYVNSPIIGAVVNSFGAIAVPNVMSGREAVRQAQQLERNALEALSGGDNILLYPSGMITLDGNETIGNKQLAYNIVKKLPDNVQVIAINMQGLWGSTFSRYKRSETPHFIRTLLLAAPKLILFKKRRKVVLTLHDITEEALLWQQEGRRGFNSNLEKLYK